MFFLVTNISIGKYYPSIITHFILGVILYFVIFFISKDFISSNTYENYKYYIGIIIIVDTFFLLYQYKYNSIRKISDDTNNNFIPKQSDPTTKNLNSSTNAQDKKKSSESRGTTELEISFSSELDDYKISHDLSIENDENLMLPVSESETNNLISRPNSKKDQSASNNITSDMCSVSFSIK